ncbi:Aminoalkylphosphonate N-acetyltransferase [bacterium HR29]|nr:Aminoalkylphosphonate N-acetyltransferase [bacterium HR29]
MTSPFARIEPYDRSRHAEGPWQVVAAVFDEYGFPFAAFDYDADLREPEQWYPPDRGGMAVAVDGAGDVVGCVAVEGNPGGVFELHRLYVLARARRRGIGEALVRWAVARARELGGVALVAYSDIAFTDAHRLYERLGFRRFRFRYAPDPWRSREWGFRLDLASAQSQAAPPTAIACEAKSGSRSAK